jgi:hypothetical protein
VEAAVKLDGDGGTGHLQALAGDSALAAVRLGRPLVQRGQVNAYAFYVRLPTGSRDLTLRLESDPGSADRFEGLVVRFLR